MFRCKFRHGARENASPQTPWAGGMQLWGGRRVTSLGDVTTEWPDLVRRWLSSLSWICIRAIYVSCYYWCSCHTVLREKLLTKNIDPTLYKTDILASLVELSPKTVKLGIGIWPESRQPNRLNQQTFNISSCVVFRGKRSGMFFMDLVYLPTWFCGNHLFIHFLFFFEGERQIQGSREEICIKKTNHFVLSSGKRHVQGSSPGRWGSAQMNIVPECIGCAVVCHLLCSVEMFAFQLVLRRTCIVKQDYCTV